MTTAAETRAATLAAREERTMKSPVRTKRQRAANEIDCDLYRLMERAERDLKDGDVIRFVLAGARPPIRMQMHPDDRAATCRMTSN